MAEVTRRTFLAFAGALGAAVAVPATAHAARRGWKPAAVWLSADIWRDH